MFTQDWVPAKLMQQKITEIAQTLGQANLDRIYPVQIEPRLKKKVKLEAGLIFLIIFTMVLIKINGDVQLKMMDLMQLSKSFYSISTTCINRGTIKCF